VTGEPSLEWGRLAALDLAHTARMPDDLVRVWQVAQESLGLKASPIERFELVGKLQQDPGRIRTNDAKKPFGAIFALAVASRTAAEPLRSASRRTATAALLAWARTYRPTGNPIDEWFFVPLLQAADLITPDIAPAERSVLLHWVTQFAISADAFFAAKGDRNPARANNWMARSLLIRTVAATVAGLTAAQPRRRGAAAGRDRAVRAGRDHRVGASSRPIRPRIPAALLSPAGQLEPWDPGHGRVVLRLARPVFPEIRSWTEDIVDHRYDPRTKLLAASYGEPQRQAQWSR
jgi:hypothetical protein